MFCQVFPTLSSALGSLARDPGATGMEADHQNVKVILCWTSLKPAWALKSGGEAVMVRDFTQ